MSFSDSRKSIQFNFADETANSKKIGETDSRKVVPFSLADGNGVYFGDSDAQSKESTYTVVTPPNEMRIKKSSIALRLAIEGEFKSIMVLMALLALSFLTIFLVVYIMMENSKFENSRLQFVLSSPNFTLVNVSVLCLAIPLVLDLLMDVSVYFGINKLGIENDDVALRYFDMYKGGIIRILFLLGLCVPVIVFLCILKGSSERTQCASYIFFVSFQQLLILCAVLVAVTKSNQVWDLKLSVALLSAFTIIQGLQCANYLTGYRSVVISYSHLAFTSLFLVTISLLGLVSYRLVNTYAVMGDPKLLPHALLPVYIGIFVAGILAQIISMQVLVKDDSFSTISATYSVASTSIFLVVEFLLTMIPIRDVKLHTVQAIEKEKHAQHAALRFEALSNQLDQERRVALALVHQMLPAKVAADLRAGRVVPPEAYEHVTIFFSDVEGFTKMAASVKPIHVVDLLNRLYTVMDYCASLFPLYKVETIGDAYMVVGGLPERSDQHALAIADFAVLVKEAVKIVKSPLDKSPIRIRMGVHSGAVMAGVVGNLMPRYCLFGDTVNTASRMESTGEVNRIHCSEAAAKLIMEHGNHYMESRGQIEVKGKGMMTTYWLTGAKDENELSNKAAIKSVISAATELLAQCPVEHMYELFKGQTSEFGMVVEFSEELAWSWHHGVKFLVVEDSTTIRKILRHKIRADNERHTIQEAEDGQVFLNIMTKHLLKALDHVQSNRSNSGHDLHWPKNLLPYDVILLDDSMPRMGGVEATQLLRAQGYQGLIIGITGKSAEEAQKFKVAGANEVLSKPLDLTMLRTTVEALWPN